MNDYIIFNQDTFPIAYPYYMHEDNKSVIDNPNGIIIRRSILTNNNSDDGLLLSEDILAEEINYLDKIINDIADVRDDNITHLTQARINMIKKLSSVNERYLEKQHRVLTRFYELINEQYRQSGVQLFGESEAKETAIASRSYIKKRRGKKKKKTLRKKGKKTIKNKKSKRNKHRKGKTRRMR